EEALGTSDTDPTSGPANMVLGREIVETGGAAATHWTFETTRNPEAGEILFQMEVSSNLKTWMPAAPMFESVPPAEAIPGKEIWRSRMPIAEMAERELYVRLRVSRP
ncbi:MAG: hypothetical protein AAF514_01920, partial [Verrucomicrobiota bacterium]